MSANEYLEIPERARVSMFLYVEERLDPGSYLRAVLSNDLRGAVGHGFGDPAFDAIGRIVRWFHNYASGYCWGSEAKVDAWLSGKEFVRCADLDQGIPLLELPEAVTRA